MKLVVGDQIEDISMVQISSDLLIPSVLMDSPGIDEVKEMAQTILGIMPPEAKCTPWVIGSTDRDILGTPRTSPSHKKGLAFDMSPVYDSENLVSPSGQCMGLAWNVVNLHTLRNLAQMDVPIAVEGDHLHIMLKGNNLLPGTIVAVPTIASAYPMSKNSELMAHVGDIFNRVFVYDPDCYTLGPATPTQQKEFYKMFNIN